MMMFGYCEKCRHTRRVRVSASGMARLGGGQRIPVGICGQCEDAAIQRARPKGQQP